MRFLPKDALVFPFLIFIVTMLPSFFNTAYPFLSIRAFFTKVLKFALLYFVIIENMNTKSKLKDLFVIAFISAVVIMMDGFGQYYYAGTDGLHFPGYPSFKARPHSDLSEGFFRGFPTACFPFPNDLAAWILLTLIPLVCVTIFALNGKWTRPFTALVSIGLFYLLFLSKTRAAWLALAISTLYIAISKKKAWLILVLILAVAIPFVFRMEMAQYIFGFSSIGDRFFMWGTSWEIFKAHPVIGNGLNTFFLSFKKYRNDEWKDKKGSYAHNCYIQMAGDVGIVGLAGFAWLIFSYFGSVIKNLKKIEDKFFNSILWGISIGVFAFLIHSFFDTNLYSLNLATLFWASIGISRGVIKVFEKSEA